MSYNFKVKNKKFIYKPISYNFSVVKNREIKYIVVHDTGNRSVGANAEKHFTFFNSGNRRASAHYFVDNKNIIQLVPDSKVAWHVGDGKGKYGITNSNSIGIEICINTDEDYFESYYTAVELVKALMKHFNIGIDNVVRHYDASKKSCPDSMKANNWKLWWTFKELLKEPALLNIDITKNSTITEVRTHTSTTNLENNKESKMVKVKFLDKLVEVENTNINNKNYVGIRDLFEKLGYIVTWENNTVVVSSPTKSEVKNSKYFKENNVHFIQTYPSNIEIKLANGKPLNTNGINGGFFNVANPGGNDSCWGIAMQSNRTLNQNSYVSNYDGKKRGTIIYDGSKLLAKKIYNIRTEYQGNIKWAISGFELYPNYNLQSEGVFSDVSRKCNHTALGFKGNNIYLMACENQYLSEFKNNILNSSIAFDYILGLDGGGSTQMYYGKDIIKSTRKLNHIVSLISM